MKKFTRTVTNTIIHAEEISKDENGNVILVAIPKITVNGKEVERGEAVNYVHEAYGDERQFFITELTYVDVQYSMTLEKFIENAEIVATAERH